jgi:hypothetical protein
MVYPFGVMRYGSIWILAKDSFDVKLMAIIVEESKAAVYFTLAMEMITARKNVDFKNFMLLSGRFSLIVV